MIWAQNRKIRLYGLERSQLRYTMGNSGHMILKGVNWVQNDKNWVNMVLKGLKCVHNGIN